MAESFVTCELDEVLVGEPLPCDVYVYINFRFITFRAKGDSIDLEAYERLELKKVRNLFVQESAKPAFVKWAANQSVEVPPPLPPGFEEFKEARENVHRMAMDIFLAKHPDKMVAQTLEASKKLVNEVMKFPFAVQTLAQLQTYSKGIVDHSVNVSVLSTYLAMQMGYAHTTILQHVGLGGLLHDIGKTKVDFNDDDAPDVASAKMQLHPKLGAELIESDNSISKEVKMIVAQHHEANDGTGFPGKLHGNQIYDLARIVAIANFFDETVADAQGTLVERQRHAIRELDKVAYKKFDPQKLEKALKILKLGV